MIQQIGLFPHQTVGENIATVPRLLGWGKARIAAARRRAARADRARSRRSCGDRYPAQLSGGQRQRVGVARALAADPPLMLMDEPFGAIDPINRTRLQDEFLALQERVRKTVVFVTHDIDEAIKMGDRIAILREGGVLAQYDTPSGDPRQPGRRLRRAVRRRRPRAQAPVAERRWARSSCSRPTATARLTPTARSRASSRCGMRCRCCSAAAAGRSRCSTASGAWPGSSRSACIEQLLASERSNAALRAGRAASAAPSGGRVTAIVARAGPVIPNFGKGELELRACTTGSSAPTGSNATGARVLWPALRQHVVLTVVAVAIGFCISMALALARPPPARGSSEPTMLS